eukprot:752273-Hanusia_phi.AAC.1
MAIIVKPSQTNQPPYWIENFSASTLRVYQEGVGKRLVYIRPYQGMPYTWESAMSSKQQLVVEVEGSSPLLSGRFELDSIGEHKPMVNSRGDVLYRVSVRCHGPTLTLSVTDALLHPVDPQLSLKADMQYLSAAHKTPSALQTAELLPSRWQFEMNLEVREETMENETMEEERSSDNDCTVDDGGRDLADRLAEASGDSLCLARLQSSYSKPLPPSSSSREVEDVASEHKRGLSLAVWRRLFEEGLQVDPCCFLPSTADVEPADLLEVYTGGQPRAVGQLSGGPALCGKEQGGAGGDDKRLSELDEDHHLSKLLPWRNRQGESFFLPGIYHLHLPLIASSPSSRVSSTRSASSSSVLSTSSRTFCFSHLLKSSSNFFSFHYKPPSAPSFIPLPPPSLLDSPRA